MFQTAFQDSPLAFQTLALAFQIQTAAPPFVYGGVLFVVADRPTTFMVEDRPSEFIVADRPTTFDVRP